VVGDKVVIEDPQMCSWFLHIRARVLTYVPACARTHASTHPKTHTLAAGITLMHDSHGYLREEQHGGAPCALLSNSGFSITLWHLKT
jgi:hypothetical protein